MNHLSEFSLLATGFLIGRLAPVISDYLTKRLNKKAMARPVVIRRKGTNEYVTIPNHYDADAVDELLKQLQKR
jgi:hypothetical protein